MYLNASARPTVQPHALMVVWVLDWQLFGTWWSSMAGRSRWTIGAMAQAQSLPFACRFLAVSCRAESLINAASIFKEIQPEPPGLQGLRILLVDDETDALDLISMELAQHGAHVTGVNSAEAALESLSTGRFDILISDIGMPQMDGYDLIRQIRKREDGTQRIPAVALTAYARVQDRMRAILAGYSTHVAKPVEANELVTVVASLAGRLGKN